MLVVPSVPIPLLCQLRGCAWVDASNLHESVNIITPSKPANTTQCSNVSQEKNIIPICQSEKDMLVLVYRVGLAGQCCKQSSNWSVVSKADQHACRKASNAY